MGRQDSLEKAIIIGKTEASRKSGNTNMRQINSLEEAAGLSSQEPSRAFEDKTFWGSLIHRVAISKITKNSII